MAHFLQVEVWAAHEAGYRTTLFSLPGTPDLIGFACAGASQIELTRRARQRFFVSRNVPYRHVPAVHLYVGGVRHDKQNDGYGTEIYTRLLESVDEALFGPRFLWLEVWADNPACELYKRWGYEELTRSPEAAPDGQARDMLTLIHDRLIRI